MANNENSKKGKCMDMCPLEEMKMREKERLLNVLEMVPGTEKDKIPKASKQHMVKCFSRSAAGKHINVDSLRPPEVLLKTINYLLSDVINSKKISWHLIYDFITDRLMAVRQDMVIQDMSIAESIAILQPIVRFHAFAAYKLCNEKISNFDPVLNNSHLQECLKKLLYLYDTCEFILNFDDNSVCNTYIKESRPEFEALYLIFNIGNDEALQRGVALPNKYKTDVVKTAITISSCFRYNNFVRVCRLVKKLPTLLAAVAVLHLPGIRKKALHVMSVAYHSKNLSYPVDVLQKNLIYENVDDLVEDCKYYGIECDNERVYFMKHSFNSKHAVIPKHESLVDIKVFVLELT